MGSFLAPHACSFPLVLSISLAGCAATTSQTTADHWEKTGYEWPSGETRPHAEEMEADELPRSMRSSERAKSLPPSSRDHDKPLSSGNAPRIAPPEPVRASRLFGNSCLRELRERKIKFTELSELKGVKNPVEVRGPLGGVTFWASDSRPLQLDCRLAIALDRLKPVFQTHGLRRVRYSGAYSYRRTRSGRLSHHALGLAIDLHDFDLPQGTQEVQGGFQKHVGCSPDVPALNRLACDMRRQALFQEFLTPDFNHDHRDHLHISVPKK